MKYIKLFENFDNFEEIVEECRDILTEAKDAGYTFHIESYPKSKFGVGSIQIFINKKGVIDPNVFWNEFEDVFQRLSGYLKDCGFSLIFNSKEEELEGRPKVNTQSIMNPMTFTRDSQRTGFSLTYTNAYRD
jgi:hypothetical protein